MVYTASDANQLLNSIQLPGALAYPQAATLSSAASVVTGSGPIQIFKSQPTGIPGASPLYPQGYQPSWLQTLTGFNPATSTQDSVIGKISSAFDPANTIGYSLGSAAGKASSTITDLFLRGTIIIIGFIFLTVGLSGFKAGQAVINPIKKVLK